MTLLADEYATLEEMSRRTGTPIDSLVNQVVRDQLVHPINKRQQAARSLIAMSVDIGDWSDIKRSLEAEAAQRYEAA